MTPTAPAAGFTLRQLPLPAKLVITTFLICVGIGYTSAMVQLHMQHGERDGEPLPTLQNITAVFAGKVLKTDGVVLKSRLEQLVSGSPTGGLSSQNMTPAFFAHDGADYRKRAADPAKKPQLDAEREGERRAVIAWINAAPETRQEAYKADEFDLTKGKEPVTGPISEDFRVKQKPGVVAIKSLLDARCVRCHGPNGEKSDIPLTTYAELDKYLPQTAVANQSGGGWVDSGRQISLEKLTQSTHAHLLSFAMLYALTGLAFAFTSYPAAARCILGPGVLVAQFADVACWWLARLDGSGPYFAMCILATGGAVGLGLAAQIVLTLFNMYGPTGRGGLAALFLIAGGFGTTLWLTVVDPYLEKEREKTAAARNLLAEPKPPPTPKVDEAKKVEAAGPSYLEKLVTGTFDPAKKGPFGKGPGGMVRAFFDKAEDGYEPAQKAEREGEQAAVLAWLRSPPDSRKAAYEADKFPLPAELAGRPLTGAYQADGAAKVKSLFTARCAVCHSPDGEQPEKLLHTFAEIEKYLGPTPPPAKQ